MDTHEAGSSAAELQPAGRGDATTDDAARQQLLRAARAGTLGVAFAGAGFGAAYELGAADVLIACGLLTPASCVAGTSAGALVAAGVRCGLPCQDVLSALKAVASELLRGGQRGRLAGVLREQICTLLPSDAAQRCSGGGGFAVTAMRVQGPCPCCWSAEELGDDVGSARSKEELAEVLLTGAHEPLVSARGRVWARLGQRRYIDGGVRRPVPRVPGAAHSVVVYPMPRRLLRRLWPYRLLLHPPPPATVAISPGAFRPWPLSRSYRKSQRLVMQPQPPGMLDLLFERGRRDTIAWLQQLRLQLPELPPASGDAMRMSATARQFAAQAPPAATQGADAGGSGGGGGGEWLRRLLATSPDALPLLLHVPEHLHHML